MINLNTYILEKFKISKDIDYKIDNISLEDYKDKEYYSFLKVMYKNAQKEANLYGKPIAIISMGDSNKGGDLTWGVWKNTYEVGEKNEFGNRVLLKIMPAK